MKCSSLVFCRKADSLRVLFAQVILLSICLGSIRSLRGGLARSLSRPLPRVKQPFNPWAQMQVRFRVASIGNCFPFEDRRRVFVPRLSFISFHHSFQLVSTR